MRAATITVPAGRRYAFRYLAEGGQWFNDEADAYQPNGFGGDDCVLDLAQIPNGGKIVWFRVAATTP